MLHPRDTASGQIVLDEGILCQINLTASYDPVWSDCAYFEVYEGTGENSRTFYALQSRSRTYDNHRIGQVSYSFSYPVIGTNVFGTVSPNPGFSSTSSVVNRAGPEPPMNAENLVYQASYDNLFRPSSNGITHYRIFCLPFDEPLCLTENDYETAEELSADSLEGCYVSIHGNGSEGCSFSWSTSCSIVTDADYNKVFSANLLYNKITASVNGKTEALDFYVIRLFGFEPPSYFSSSSAFYNTVGVSREFGLTYARTSGGQITGFVSHNIATKSFEILSSNYDPDFSKTGHPDYPDEILNYAGCKPDSNGVAPATATDAQIIFGSSDSQAFDGVNSVGSSSVMPNIWQTPRPSCADTAVVTNSERFNGIWWAFAAWSKCGDNFPQMVTTGNLYGVPVAKIEIDNTDWKAAYYAMATQQMQADITDNVVTADESSETSNSISFFSNPGLDEIVTSPSIKDSQGNYRTGTLDLDSSIYLLRPNGKHLSRIIWRVFQEPVTLLSQIAGFTPTYFSADMSCEVIGNLVKRKSDFPANSLGLAYTGSGVYFTPYNVTGVPLVNGTSSEAASFGLGKYERSVNGDSARYLGQKIGIDAYIPTLSKTKVAQLFGAQNMSSLKVNIITALVSLFRYKTGTDYSLADYVFDQKLYVYPRFDFSYIAVWEDGDEPQASEE